MGHLLCFEIENLVHALRPYLLTGVGQLNRDPREGVDSPRCQQRSWRALATQRIDAGSGTATAHP